MSNKLLLKCKNMFLFSKNISQKMFTLHVLPENFLPFFPLKDCCFF